MSVQRERERDMYLHVSPQRQKIKQYFLLDALIVSLCRVVDSSFHLFFIDFPRYLCQFARDKRDKRGEKKKNTTPVSIRLG